MTQPPPSDAQKERVEFVIRLERIQELFDAPEFDPFVEQARFTAGLDDIVAYLSTIPMRRPPAIQTTLVLPPEQVTPELQAQTQAAVSALVTAGSTRPSRPWRPAASRGGQNCQSVCWPRSRRFQPLRLSILLTPDYLNSLLLVLTPVITVIVWVSIWNPVETLAL